MNTGNKAETQTQAAINKKQWIERITSNIEAVSRVEMYNCVLLFYNNSKTNVIRKVRAEQRQRQTERQIIGHALSTKDYKVILLQLQISHASQNEKIDKLKYKTIAKSIVFEAFRELQRFLQQHCKRQISKLKKNQLQAISKELLDSRNLLPFDQAVTFRAFIRIIFGFSSITMSEYFAAQLYSTLMKLLILQAEQKTYEQIVSYNVMEELSLKPEKRYSQTRQLNQKWNKHYQQFLLQNVKHQQSHFGSIRDSFRLKFPQSKQLFTSQSLRNRFYSILRTAIKKFKAIVESYRDRLPEMVVLDNDRARNIIKSGAGTATKQLLLQIYQMSETKINFQLIVKTIQRVNEFMLTREKDISLAGRQAQDRIACKELYER